MQQCHNGGLHSKVSSMGSTSPIASYTSSLGGEDLSVAGLGGLKKKYHCKTEGVVGPASLLQSFI